MSVARYFTVQERLPQPPVRSDEVMPSPSMYDELLVPLWWTPSGVTGAMAAGVAA
jgi:hypothetical protein